MAKQKEAAAAEKPTTKLKKTAGGGAMVIKSLDERISHQPMVYLPPTAPHGPADQLGFERGRSSTHKTS